MTLTKQEKTKKENKEYWLFSDHIRNKLDGLIWKIEEKRNFDSLKHGQFWVDGYNQALEDTKDLVRDMRDARKNDLNQTR